MGTRVLGGRVPDGVPLLAFRSHSLVEVDSEAVGHAASEKNCVALVRLCQDKGGPALVRQEACTGGELVVPVEATSSQSKSFV